MEKLSDKHIEREIIRANTGGMAYPGEWLAALCELRELRAAQAAVYKAIGRTLHEVRNSLPRLGLLGLDGYEHVIADATEREKCMALLRRIGAAVDEMEKAGVAIKPAYDPFPAPPKEADEQQRPGPIDAEEFTEEFAGG